MIEAARCKSWRLVVPFCSIYEVGNTEINSLCNFSFYTTNCTPRGNLRKEIRNRGRAEFSPNSFKWLSEVAHALDYVHSKGFWHLNGKPNNILYDDCGCAWLLDFGGLYFAPLFNENQEIDAEIVPFGWQHVEQLPYLHLDFKSQCKYDVRTDLFALAVTLFEFINGETPYSGTSYFSYLTSVTQGHSSLFDTVDWVNKKSPDAVERALKMEPDRRFESCSEFAMKFSPAKIR